MLLGAVMLWRPATVASSPEHVCSLLAKALAAPSFEVQANAAVASAVLATAVGQSRGMPVARALVPALLPLLSSRAPVVISAAAEAVTCLSRIAAEPLIEACRAAPIPAMTALATTITAAPSIQVCESAVNMLLAVLGAAPDLAVHKGATEVLLGAFVRIAPNIAAPLAASTSAPPASRASAARLRAASEKIVAGLAAALGPQRWAVEVSRMPPRFRDGLLLTLGKPRIPELGLEPGMPATPTT
jgi:hypothetical protein